MDELASGINRMAEALLSAREELQQSIDQATEDVQQNLETIEIQNIELDLARRRRWRPAVSSPSSRQT